MLISGETFAMWFGCSKLIYGINLQMSIRLFLGRIRLNNRFSAGLSMHTHGLCLCGYSFPVFKFLRVNNAHPY